MSTNHNQPSDALYYEASNPLEFEDVKISQTPSQALKHKHFIVGYIINILACFFVNVGIAALLLRSFDRMGLTFSPTKVLDGGVFYTYSSLDIGADMLLSLFFVVLFTVLTGDMGSRGDVAKGKAIPIPNRELRPYRWFGVTLVRVLPRIFVMALWTMLIVFPFVYGMMSISCHTGTMASFIGPESENIKQCHIPVNLYIWAKGGYCALACVVVFPFLELAGLNRDNLSDTEYNSFLSTKNVTTDIEAQSDLTSMI